MCVIVVLVRRFTFKLVRITLSLVISMEKKGESSSKKRSHRVPGRLRSWTAKVLKEDTFSTELEPYIPDGYDHRKNDPDHPMGHESMLCPEGDCLPVGCPITSRTMK